LRLKDDIETARELSIMVANQESDWVSTLGDRPCDVPRLLRHPLAVGIGTAAGEMHTPTREFDEEQDVQPPQRDRVDREEIDGDHAPRLRVKELTPRWTRALTRGAEMFLA
jgi:hypothetical protein